VIPNGFDTDLFAPSETARVEIRSMLGLARSAVLIGLIGRYHPVKYHAGFLRVAARLGRAHPEVHFVLAGSGVDSHNCSLDSLIEESGLSGRVHLLGERKDIPRITAALDIAASASLSEAFPNVIGEAMSCAVPCVATNVGDTSHAIGDTGRVVSPKDEKAMEKALSELLNMGEASRRRLGLAARRRVIGLFSLPVVADRYRALYERVLSRKT
jgi:glycosyltransferase involved in cell wall biosynthesis